MYCPRYPRFGGQVVHFSLVYPPNPRFGGGVQRKVKGFWSLCAKVKKCCFCAGQKCADKVFNDVCNCMKMRDLTFKKVGRKYVRFFARGIAVSEKITTFASQ